MSASPVRGHRPVWIAEGDWRCACGVRLSGGPLGTGRLGARDVMRFHRADLMMKTPAFQERLAQAESPSAQFATSPSVRAQVRGGLSYIRKRYSPPLRWMVWPRMYGKTFRLLTWWLEDPEGRVIITMDEHAAQNTRQCALEMRGNGDYQGPPSLMTPAEWKKLADRNILGVTRWQRLSAEPGGWYASKQFALDELKAMIDQLAGMPPGSHVAWIAAEGVNEPLPEGLAMVPHYARTLRALGGGGGGMLSSEGESGGQ